MYVAALATPFRANPSAAVYKTVDGGLTWQQLLFVSDQTGAVDIGLSTNADVVSRGHVARGAQAVDIISGDDKENGIYVSEDAGDTWTKITRGLPDGVDGQDRLCGHGC